jgi:TRL-like protein family
MKKLLHITVVVGLAVVLVGCASPIPVGSLFTNISLPVNATDEGSGSKVGEAACSSYFTLIATGDCSIEAAKQSGSISKVSHVDWHAHNILGVIGHYKVIVHGE